MQPNCARKSATPSSRPNLIHRPKPNRHRATNSKPPPQWQNRQQKNTHPPRIREKQVQVGLVGLEPMTSTMSTWRSNQLSYNPILLPLLVYVSNEINYSMKKWKKQ